MSTEATQLAVWPGMAKPIPRAQGSIAVVTPTTSPRASRSGPPELPGLMDASVCTSPSSMPPSGVGRFRCRAETTPSVTERSNPRGLPMASTSSPTASRRSESASTSRSRAATRSTARSVRASAPTTSAGTTFEPESRTRGGPPPRATCAFVRRYPSCASTTPEPCPRRCSTPTTAGAARATSPATSAENAWSPVTAAPPGRPP